MKPLDKFTTVCYTEYMDYRLPAKTFKSKRCVLRCTLESMIRDISYYNLVDGLMALKKFKESWQTFETAVSLELYEYGQLIGGWSKQEGDYDMGKLQKSYSENRGDLALFTTARIRQAMIKNKVPFQITRIAETTSTISGNKQYILTLLYGKEFTYLDENDDKQVMKAGEERAISLDSDINRDDVFSKKGDNYIGDELPYGPCVLNQRGKYYRVEDVEEDEFDDDAFFGSDEETDEEANERHVAVAVSSAKKAKAKK